MFAKVSKKVKVIAAIIFILTGYLLCYFESYKNLSSLNTLAGIFIVIGWIIILVTFFKDFFPKNKKDISDNTQANQSKPKVTWLVSRLIFFTLNIGNIIFANYLSDLRVNIILNNEPSQVAIATVVGFEEKYISKSGGITYAVIIYRTEDKLIHQYINDSKEQYQIGQKIKIKYSVEYPDMFAVI
jgi:NADH:ubiquinone oxidoreductase subunit 5 (subunit L)/multisubunit Na+/H+ antiporter MnhA subunit